MTVQAGSRYTNTPIVNLAVNGNTLRVLVPGPQEGYAFQYTAYMTTGKDRPDTMSNDFFGDPTQWWQIAMANPEILDWSNLPSGSVIRIPSIS